MASRNFKLFGVALARAASDKKAERIALLHVGRQSPVADYMLLATASSRPHLEAVEDAIEKAAKELGVPPVRRARPKSDQWRVLDYGGLIVHVMTQESRDHYALEKLFDQAKPVEWDPEPKAAAKPAKKHARKHG